MPAKKPSAVDQTRAKEAANQFAAAASHGVDPESRTSIFSWVEARLGRSPDAESSSTRVPSARDAQSSGYC